MAWMSFTVADGTQQKLTPVLGAEVKQGKSVGNL